MKEIVTLPENVVPICSCPEGAKGLHEPDGCILTDPDWGGTCEVCGESPIVPMTGMCGPCTFGEAETAGGNW